MENKHDTLKKLISLSLIFLLSLSLLTACGDSENKDSEKVKPQEETQVEEKEITEEEIQEEEPVVEEPVNQDTPAKNKEKGNKNSREKQEIWDFSSIPDPIDTISKDNGDMLILVNKFHAVSKKFVPTDLVEVDPSLSSNKGILFKSEAYEAFKAMRKDAKKEGLTLVLCSTYRSVSGQAGLYESYLAYDSVENVNTYSAYPGRSEHHTGWAADITSPSAGYGLPDDFDKYPEGAWLKKNAYKYGFILRYPKGKTHITGYMYEPWHYRYVGVDVATYITENGLTLEEYLGQHA